MSKKSLRSSDAVNEIIEKSDSDDDVDIETIPSIVDETNNRTRRKIIKSESLRKKSSNPTKVSNLEKPTTTTTTTTMTTRTTMSSESSDVENRLEPMRTINDAPNKMPRKKNKKVDRQNSIVIQPKNAWSNEPTESATRPQQPAYDKKLKVNKDVVDKNNNDDEDDDAKSGREDAYSNCDLPALLILFETTFAMKNDELNTLKNCEKKLDQQFEFYSDSLEERRRKIVEMIDKSCADFKSDLELRYNWCTENCKNSRTILQNVVNDMQKIDKKKDKLTDKHLKSLRQHFARWQKEYASMPNAANLTLKVLLPDFSLESISDILGAVVSADSSATSSAAPSPEKKINGGYSPTKSAKPDGGPSLGGLCLLSQFSCRRRKDKQACGITDVTLNASGDVFVVDKHNKTLKIFDMGGTFKNCTSKNAVKKPMRVSYLVASDKLIVTDEGKNELILYATDLSSHKKLLALQFPVSHDYFGDNMIAVLEFNSKSIMIYDLTGMLVNMFPTKMECPAYIACTPGRKIAVTDWKTSQFKIFNSSGVEIFSNRFSHFDSNSMEEPYGVCCDDRGNVFVADKKKSALFVFSESGVVERVYTSEKDHVGTPFAVAVNSNGILAVAEYAGTVRLFRYAKEQL